MRRSLLYTGPGRDDDTTWEQRTGGVEGPVIAALRPLNLNLVRGKACTHVLSRTRDKSLMYKAHDVACICIANADRLHVAGLR